MKKHANLYADLSTRNPFPEYHKGYPTEERSLTDKDGKLQKGWKDVFEEFPDRFTFGSDIGADDKRHEILGQVIENARSYLGQLKPETAEKIGHLNARKLLGLVETK